MTDFDDDIPPEVDFTGGVRGKYAERFKDSLPPAAPAPLDPLRHALDFLYRAYHAWFGCEAPRVDTRRPQYNDLQRALAQAKEALDATYLTVAQENALRARGAAPAPLDPQWVEFLAGESYELDYRSGWNDATPQEREEALERARRWLETMLAIPARGGGAGSPDTQLSGTPEEIARAHREAGNCGICGAPLPHATDEESLKRANALHDAYENDELGAVQAERPRDPIPPHERDNEWLNERPRVPSDAAVSAALEAAPTKPSEAGLLTVAVVTVGEAREMLRAAYAIDFGGAPTEETKP
jgi:hypothetical protein